VLVLIAGEKKGGDILLGFDNQGRLDAVHNAVEADIHENGVRRFIADCPDRRLTVGYHGGNLTAQLPDIFGQHQADQLFIFNNQYLFRHGRYSGARNRMAVCHRL